MPIFDFFRNFFIGGNREDFGDEGKHSFRNPIWQNDEDDNDDDDFRHLGRSNVHVHIFNDPKEMASYFESQFDNIINSIFSSFDDSKIFSLPGSIEELPSAGQSNNSLRDKMLKPGYENPDSYNHEKLKVDADLDGKISADNFFKFWNESDETKVVPSYTNPSTNQSYRSSKFITKRFIHAPDGTIEQHQIVKDSEGNEEKIISKQIGDKKYVVTTKRDKNGVETKVEDLINIDESELKNFKPNIEQTWGSIYNHYSNTSSILNYLPWDHFFGPNPKL
ncbi:HCLS1-associated protein X-1 [Vespula maculifrons]|uniref:HCLS1-associated protein X-1 n=1 Tax=Vespula maculifrons TaxID=7453 RepID=A0ABD2BQR2_VESMC